MQRDDFYGILKVMGDRPVTIRLLDPPLHEFLPHNPMRKQKSWLIRLDVPYSDSENKS